MTIAVFGNYGVHNLGDDLILQGLLKSLPHDTELIVFCGQPAEVQQRFGFKSFPFFPGGMRSGMRSLLSSRYRRELKAGWEALQACDRIIIGGGGILVDHHLRALFLWKAQLDRILKSGKPFSFLGNSFELNSTFSQDLFLPFLRKAQEITVRDQASLHFLERQGLQGRLVPDFSELAELPSVTSSGAVPTICLALCRWGQTVGTTEVLRSFVRQQRNAGYRVVGLAFQSQGDDDRVYLNRLDPSLEVFHELPDVLRELGSAKLLVGMRLHSLVLAIRLKIPFVAIAYQQKVRNYLADRDRGNRVIDVQDLTLDTLQALFKKVIEGSEEFR